MAQTTSKPGRRSILWQGVLWIICLTVQSIFNLLAISARVWRLLILWVIHHHVKYFLLDGTTSIFKTLQSPFRLFHISCFADVFKERFDGVSIPAIIWVISNNSLHPITVFFRNYSIIVLSLYESPSYELVMQKYHCFLFNLKQI